MNYNYFIGIDIAKDFFDVALSGMPERAQRFDNAPEGFAAFREAFARELPMALIVMEATGGYEAALLADLLPPDTDRIEALAADRAALWERLTRAPFLTLNEKRVAAGYGAMEGGDRFV